LNIGIKYCGGCNPRYNRSGFIVSLKDKYKDKVELEPIKEDILYDMIIIMNGCSSACISKRSIKYKAEILSVASSEDFHIAYEAIDKILNK